MLTLGQINEHNVLPITVEGQIRKQDYDELLPRLEAMFKAHGALRFYLDLKDFHGFELGALWEEVKFDMKHRKDFNKTAVVGEDGWEKWGTKMSNLFFGAEMKFFPREQADDAWTWVNG